jgi:hypothetical protein
VFKFNRKTVTTSNSPVHSTRRNIMFQSISARRARFANRVIPFCLAASALLLTSANVGADSLCRKVHGDFNIVPVNPPVCTSPVGVCGQGSFKGGIKGDYFSPFTAILPTADTGTTGVILFTSDTTVTDAKIGNNHGDLTFKEAGAFNTAGNGEFTELFSVVSGTGDFVGATGVLQSTGMTSITDGGTGVYDGEICVP